MGAAAHATYASFAAIPTSARAWPAIDGTSASRCPCPAVQLAFDACITRPRFGATAVASSQYTFVELWASTCTELPTSNRTPPVTCSACGCESAVRSRRTIDPLADTSGPEPGHCCESGERPDALPPPVPPPLPVAIAA